MSSHTSEPFPGDFDRTIRDALMAAADSVEPGADGLDRIRAKIVVRHATRASRWHAGPSRGAAGWKPFHVTGTWVSALIEAVIERFRPDPTRAGWLGWLRPAAAIATGVFVVTAASWAVAALPAAIAPVNNWRHYHSTTPQPRSLSGSASRSRYSSSGGGTTGPGGQNGNTGGGGSATPSCSPSGGGTPSGSPSASPSTTPSGSPSPSTSPSTGTATPTSPATSTEPAATPSSTLSPGQNQSSSPAATQSPDAAPSHSPDATGKALLDAVSSTELTSGTGGQLLPTQTPVPSPVPSATVTPQPSQPGGPAPCG